MSGLEALAKAWDEGYEAGLDDEAFDARGLSTDPDAHEHPHENPYRADLKRRRETEDTDQATRGRAPADQHLARVRAEVRPTVTFETETAQEGK